MAQKKKAVKAISGKGTKSVAKKAVAKAKTPAAKSPARKVVKPQAKSAPKSSVKKHVVGKVGAKVVKKSVVKAAVKPKAKTPVKKVSKPKTPIKKQEVKKVAVKKVVKKAPAAKEVAPKVVQPVAKKPAPPKPAETENRMAYGVYGGFVLCENPKPFPRKSPYTEKEIRDIHKILIEERMRLRQVLRDLDGMTLRRSSEDVDSAVKGYSEHLAENATDNVDTETALMLRRDEETVLVQVEAALERLEKGLFGVCLACGSKIGIERLKAKPEAHLCMDCKRTYDRKIMGR